MPLRYAIALTMLFLMFPLPVRAAAPIVWVEDSMTRVMKTDPAKNTTAITLNSAKNEYEPFQIIVKAPPANALSGVNVIISDLSGPQGARISANNLTPYREHYVQLVQGSKRYAGETNPPAGPGWYPDALIPFRHPDTGADLTGRFDAVPFAVASGENQPIWVDIYTPASVPEGTYTGTATVTSDQGDASVQIELQVWGFTLPRTRSLQGFTHTNESYLNRNHAIELIKHRLNPKSIRPQDERFYIDTYAVDMNDVFRTSGATRLSCQTSSPPSIAEVQAEAALHQPDITLIDSYANEVFACASAAPEFLAWANALRSGGIHPMIVTYPLQEFMGPDLDHTAGDLWSFLPKHYDVGKTNITTLVNHGISVWAYNPLIQEGYSPKFTIDFSPINFRMMHSFINQSLGFRGTKFWKADNWTADPWTNTEASRPDAPGEGHLVYPGADVGLPAFTIPSFRLKIFREGSEDFEYVELLKKAGEGSFALATVRNVATDFRTWSKDKNVLLAARKTLGDKLHSLSAGLTPTPTPPPPTSSPSSPPSPTSPLSPSPPLSPPSCPRKSQGDADCNGTINLADYEAWRREYRQEVTTRLADFTGDGNVSLADYESWRTSYQSPV